MKFEDKMKANTQMVCFTCAGGAREVLVEGKFKYYFKPNDEGKSVCNVPTNSHREWMYKMDWFVPYAVEEKPKAVRVIPEEPVDPVEQPDTDKPVEPPQMAVIKTIGDRIHRGRPRKLTGA